MLLKSKRRTAPSWLAASASFARPSRYVRRRSVLTRSSQSTVCAPGEANGRGIADSPVAAEAWRRPAVGAGRGRCVAFNDATRPPRQATCGHPWPDRRGGSTMAATSAHGEVCVARQGNGSAPEYGAIGEHLREVRIARGLSLRALAGRVGVSPSLISQVETGRARP